MQINSSTRITAMGLGRFGGQIAAIEYLAQKGAHILVTDRSDPATLQQSVLQLEKYSQIEYRWGPHAVDDFLQADLILVSPAVPPHHPCLLAAKEAGIPITTEIELLLELYDGLVIAVSGTVGKSTTASMIETILSRDGYSVALGGNIGRSLLPERDSLAEFDYLILELSSFQLEWLRDSKPRFQIAVLTNFSPHHLDWHQNFDNYRLAKQVLFAGQMPEDAAVVPLDCTDFQSVGQRINYDLGSHIGPPWRLFPHDYPNLYAAIAVAKRIGISEIDAYLHSQFHNQLPHRCEPIMDWFYRIVVNDSKATTPIATIAALKAMKVYESSTWLILGGASALDDSSELLSLLAEQEDLRGIALIGTDEALCDAVLNLELSIPCKRFTDLAEATKWCVYNSYKGDVILLSPSRPSFDQFVNYEARGEAFVASLDELDPHDLIHGV